MSVAPSSDVLVTGWVPNPSGPVYAVLNEATADDANYAAADTGPSEPLILGLDRSLSAGSYTFRLRAWVSRDSGDMQVSLLDTSNVVKGASGLVPVTGAAATYTFHIVTSDTTSRIKIETGSVGTLSLEDGTLSLGDDVLEFV